MEATVVHGAAEGAVSACAFVDEGVLKIFVSNSGRPIPPEALERLFQPFTREDTRTRQNGLGLGLYIASEIARAHEGELTVISTMEETRFTFRMSTSA